LTDALDDGIVVVGSGAKRKGEVQMDILTVPAPVRQRLGDAASDGLVTMFADAHRLAMESFERRLAEELAKFRLDMVEQMAQLRFELLKWSFLFWIGQVAVMIAVLSWMLRGVR
jgi:hypothetical protein